MFEYALTAWGLINWYFAAAKEQILLNLPLQDATRRVRPTMTSAPDDVLELLRQRGRHLDPSALDSLRRVVAAAPEGLAGPEWVELIDPQADPELTKALTAWRAALATADDGLDAAPAPAARLAALRAELKRRDLSGFVVPRADEHQGEYVPRPSHPPALPPRFTRPPRPPHPPPPPPPHLLH